MAITVTPVVNGRRGGLGMLTFAFVYFKTENTQSYRSVLAFCFRLTSTGTPKCSAALQWELPGSACAGPSLDPTPPGPCALLQHRLQQSCWDCHVLSGCSLDTVPSGWGTWKLFQGYETNMCSQIFSREGGCYRSATEETAGTTPSNICRF